MPFWVVSALSAGVGRGIGILHGVVIVEGEGAVLGEFGASLLMRSCARATRSFQITLGRTCSLTFL